MMDVVSVDCGRSSVKAVSETERIYFPSALGTWRQLRNNRQMKIDDLDVTFEGSRYFVGRIALEESDDGARMMVAYKAHQDTKILTLAVIHRLVHNNAKIMLVTGLPLAFHNTHDIEKMKHLLLGTYDLSVNGEQKHFTVERVEVAAEGASVAWSCGRIRRERFHVVDVGSRTVNYATAINGRWVDKESDSLDYGFETFRGSEQQFARVLIADLGKLLRPLNSIVLIGGKESLLGHLQSFHKDVVLHEDPLFANAVAFRELGVIANAKAQKKTASGQ